MTSSNLHKWHYFHVDIISIPGASIDSVAFAFRLNTTKWRLLVGGLNNLDTGESSDQIIDAIMKFQAHVIGRNDTSTFSAVSHINDSLFESLLSYKPLTRYNLEIERAINFPFQIIENSYFFLEIMSEILM